MFKAFFLAIIASFFFAATFILNRKMQLSGGSWMWTASLRFYFMLPLLFAIVAIRGKLGAVLRAIRRDIVGWIVWSTVGFGFFYAFLCFASAYGPSWMVAATWQITIIAGVLLTPLFSHKLPKRQLAAASVIVLGVFMVLIRDVSGGIPQSSVICFAAILVAAFAYPLGNRKMMAIVSPEIGTIERVFGMTLCSMPFWLALSAFGCLTGSYPTASQAAQSALVAVFAGVVATILFFKATEMTRSDPRKLAVIESTQSGEVVFSLLGGLVLLGEAPPSPLAFAGLGLIVVGIVLNALITGTAR